MECVKFDNRSYFVYSKIKNILRLGNTEITYLHF